MKKLLAFFFGAFLLSSYVFAQVNETLLTTADFERYIEAKLEMDYRNSTIKNLGLTSEEIIEFDPIYREYMREKSKSFDKKMKLLANYRAEMAEDDGQANQDEDRADYIEDYWEIEIAESEMRKDYFDRLENKISKDAAAQFFLWEEALENRLYNNIVADVVPKFVDLENMPSTDRFMTSNTTGETMAKTDDVSDEEYSNYIDNKLEVEFRNVATDALNFTSEEIIAFDPVYRNYMRAKDRLVERKLGLLEEYLEEMKEDDSAQNQAEDRADFIEEYWEVAIDEKELAKDYFDILEDKIDVDKAAKFFLFEKAVENRIASEVIIAIMPELIIIETQPTDDIDKVEQEEKPVAVERKPVATLSVNSQTLIRNFGNWVADNEGQVSLSHEYTSNGLKSLVNVIAAVKDDLGIDIPKFAGMKATVMSDAIEITEDWKETDHADHTKDAFLIVADMMSYLNKEAANNLRSVANKMNDDVLMTNQANVIYEFFDEANTSLQRMNKVTVKTKTSISRSQSRK